MLPGFSLSNHDPKSMTSKQIANPQSYIEVRELFPRLSLCLLFSPAFQRSILADILLFLHALDHSLDVASEPMLARIRLQWWREALTNLPPSAPPLASRLHAHIQATIITADNLTTLISHAETACASSHPEARAAYWQAGICLMAQITGIEPDAHVEAIGRSLYYSQYGHQHAPPHALASTRFYARHFGRGAEFLLIMAYLVRASTQRDLNTDHSLIFKIMWHIMFKPR